MTGPVPKEHASGPATGFDSMWEAMPEVEATMREVEGRGVPQRIWARDHTVWKPDPTEITNRLGWLTVLDAMRERSPALEAFGRGIRDAGFRDVVLLGMGGSSLGPEVLWRTFGSAGGHPRLTVLDSTVPSAVQAVAASIDPAKTLFLVSSKSGGTIEPLSLYKYFRNLVGDALGAGPSGSSFVAITDSNTGLEKMARDQGFREVFLADPDIGGRYSVLSHFGMVPAALIGLDIGKLLDRGDTMRQACGPGVAPRDNPGAQLGVALGAMALRGKDKVTLVMSPGIRSFGLWAEQLLAESTGKEGKGLVPIAGEPLVDPECYGDDRVFVYSRMEGDNNGETDQHIEALRAAGHPVVTLALEDRFDLGAEFFRWEFATSVAGAVLRIHPFDQPNVQQAKDLTSRVLKGDLSVAPGPGAESTLVQLLSHATEGDYLAIMAYVRERPEMDAALDLLRKKVAEQGTPATAGYGPRVLHSTGQLHKGGPDSGLFLQIMARHDVDLPVPGEEYSFGTLARAQAAGDLAALHEAGRRVISVEMDSDDPIHVLSLAETLA